jgi:hypothetical protein
MQREMLASLQSLGFLLDKSFLLFLFEELSLWLSDRNATSSPNSSGKMDKTLKSILKRSFEDSELEIDLEAAKRKETKDEEERRKRRLQLLKAYEEKIQVKKPDGAQVKPAPIQVVEPPVKKPSVLDDDEDDDDDMFASENENDASLETVDASVKVCVILFTFRS